MRSCRTRKADVDVFAMDKIIMPYNVSNMHWALAVVDVRKSRICYYDR
jgi:Ulp1 family protease